MDKNTISDNIYLILSSMDTIINQLYMIYENDDDSFDILIEVELELNSAFKRLADLVNRRLG
jgi:hypothetical protein